MKQQLKNGLGIRLGKIRNELHLTQEQLAEQLGLSPRYVAAIEGEDRGMSAAAVCRACERLSVSADYLLLGREGARNPDILGEMLQNLDPRDVERARQLLELFCLSVGRARSEAAGNGP